MTANAIFESDTFNRRLVEKIVEHYERIRQGDEVSVWQQIALELSQNWELDCDVLRWQDLSRYFKRSLVFKLTHRKWITDQEIIDRLQYPYLRKVYVMTIHFYEKRCTTVRTLTCSEIEDNKMFIKYAHDGRFDPEVVAAFKRRSRKGSRIYVNINVGDPVYNLSDDLKKLLLQMEHQRKDRTHCNADTNEKAISPMVLDGVPVAIDDRSPREKDFSARDLLEKESFTVNTQEYDEIIKESLEQELPPLAKRPRTASFGAVEIWLESNEILSKSSSIVVGQDDPLRLSARRQSERMDESIKSEECCEGAQSNISNIICNNSVWVKQEFRNATLNISNDNCSMIPSNAYDIFTDSDSEHEEEYIPTESERPENSQQAIERYVPSLIGGQQVDDDELVAASNKSLTINPAEPDMELSVSGTAKNDQPAIAEQETVDVKTEVEYKKFVVPSTILTKPAFDPYDIFTDSEDEEDDVDISDGSRRIISDSSIDCQQSYVEQEINHSAADEDRASNNSGAPTNVPGMESTSPVAQTKPIQSESSTSEPIISIQSISAHPDDEASFNTRPIIHVQEPIAENRSQIEQETSGPNDKSIPSPNMSTIQTVTVPGAIMYHNSTGHTDFPVLNNSLVSVPLHCIAKPGFSLSVATENSTLNEHSGLDANGTEEPTSTSASVIEPETSEPPHIDNNVVVISEVTTDRNQNPITANPSNNTSMLSDDSRKMVIAWSYESASNSTGPTQISDPLSPTGPKFQNEHYDPIRPTIENRLRFQIVLRSLWPELFTKSASFCDFQHLVSVLAGNIFPLLQPTNGPAALALHRMVTPIACGLAYGYFEPNDDYQTCHKCGRNLSNACEEKHNSIDQRIDEDRTHKNDSQRSENSSDHVSSSGEASSVTVPTIVISDVDDSIMDLPVRTKRKYRLHQ